VFAINNRRETPEEQRERLRQEELKENSTGALNDGFNRGENGNLADSVGGLGWKEETRGRFSCNLNLLILRND
jgi:Family of unknown function (DUF6366)